MLTGEYAILVIGPPYRKAVDSSFRREAHFQAGALLGVSSLRTSWVMGAMVGCGLCRRREPMIAHTSSVQEQHLATLSRIRRVRGCPNDPYEVIFLDQDDQIIVPLTEWYRLRKDQGPRSTRETYLGKQKDKNIQVSVICSKPLRFGAKSSN